MRHSPETSTGWSCRGCIGWHEMVRAAAICVWLSGLIWAGAAMAERSVLGQGDSREGGIAVHWSITAGADPAVIGFATLDVAVTDSRTGAPVAYESGAILGWLQRRQASLIEPDRSCGDTVMALATQGIGQRGDIDLNGYRIVTLNSDGSIAFINPFVGFNNAKLESILDLQARPVAWVQVLDRMEYWVLLADPGRLVAVDLQTRRVTRTIDLPPGAVASGLTADVASQTLWIPMPGIAGIGTVDLRKQGTPLRLRDAKGLVRFFSAPTGTPMGWADAENRLTLLANAQPVKLGSPPVAVLDSVNAAATVVAEANGVVSLFAQEGSLRKRIAVPHALRAMAFFDGDRRALVAGGDQASVIDLATGSITLSFAVEPGSEQIAMTRDYAYILGAPSGRASMIALDDLSRGRPQVLDIILSASAPPDAGGTAAIPVVAAPEGDGLLLASPSDGMIYQYSEGMMAPSGSYSNYRRAPVAVGIVDYALRQIGDGHYRAAFRVGSGGRYDLRLGGIGPRFSVCETVALPGDPAFGADQGARIHASLLEANTLQGVTRIRVRVAETPPEKGGPTPIAGLSDLKLLVFDKRSGWQRRFHLQELGGGDYQAEVPVPRKSSYDLLVSSASANLSYVEGQMGEKVLGGAP